MKKLFLVGAGLGLSVFGSIVWLEHLRFLSPPAIGKLVADNANSSLDSTLLITTGVVSAGGNEPLLARTHGRVQGLFFSAGDYVRRGQVLVRLDNHTFITAPRAGFLGPNLTAIGQYIVQTTPVTTLSRHSYLVIMLPLPKDWLGGINSGDSVRVWAASPPTRIASGVVGSIGQPVAEDALLEVVLTSRAPFRVGETAYVRLQDKREQVAVR